MFRQNTTWDARTVAIVAIMAALVFVATSVIKVPTPIGGYVHLGDAIIVFAAIAYGPIVGAIAAGVGTAAADLAGGYFQWAAISFLVHGAQGYLVGKLVHMDELKTLKPYLWYIIGAASVVVVVVGYFLGGIILVGVGGAVSEVGFNTAQAAIGSLLGILLYLAIKKAYPQISKL